MRNKQTSAFGPLRLIHTPLYASMKHRHFALQFSQALFVVSARGLRRKCECIRERKFDIYLWICAQGVQFVLHRRHQRIDLSDGNLRTNLRSMLIMRTCAPDRQRRSTLPMICYRQWCVCTTAPASRCHYVAGVLSVDDLNCSSREYAEYGLINAEQFIIHTCFIY